MVYEIIVDYSTETSTQSYQYMEWVSWSMKL